MSSKRTVHRPPVRRGRPAKRKTRTMSVPRNKIGFPQAMRTTLRAVHTEVLTPSTTAIDSLAIQANGLYQPFSGLTNEPRGFSQFMAIYGVYTVQAARCKVRFMYTGYDGPSTLDDSGDLVKTFTSAVSEANAQAASPYACGIRKGTSIVADTVVCDDMVERERTNHYWITPQEGVQTVTSRLSQRDFYKNPDGNSAEGYAGGPSANPAIPTFFQVWAARPTDGSSNDASSVTALIEVEFDVVFTAPKDLVRAGASGA